MSTIPVHVSKGPPDPICTRISVGGGPNAKHYYCVYRGSLDSSIAALDAALNALRTLKYTGAKEPPVNRAFKELGAS